MFRINATFLLLIAALGAASYFEIGRKPVEFEGIQTTVPNGPDGKIDAQSLAAMDPELRQFFLSPNDFKLANEIFIRVSRLTDSGDAVSQAKLPIEQRVVYHIWGAEGLIGNGGFEYWFTSDVADCLGLADAYDTIGLPGSAKAVRKSFTIFPNSIPPDDCDERAELVVNRDENGKKILAECDHVIYDSSRAMQQKLGVYIRANIQAFATLKPAGGKRSGIEAAEELAPPSNNALSRDIVKWLASIGARADRRADIPWIEQHPITLPESGDFILRVELGKHRNSTDVELSHLARMTNLRELREIILRETSFTTAGLKHLAAFPNLQVLELNGIEFDDDAMAQLLRLKSLRSIAGAVFTDGNLESLTALENLERITIGSPGVTDRGIRHLAPLPKLKRLLLWGTSVTGTTLANFQRLPIEELHLSDCRQPLSNEGLLALAEFRELKRVSFRDSPLEDEGLRGLSECSKLEHIELAGTKVTNDGMKHLSKLVMLEDVDIYHSAVADAGLEHLTRLPRLRRLSIHGKLLTDASLKHLGEMTALRNLSLNNSQITDSTELRRLANLKNLESLGLPDRLESSEHAKFLVEQLPKTGIRFEAPYRN
ncbi:MAG: DUF4375 domain-containing protein [Planctomycetaceae bacterium]